MAWIYLAAGDGSDRPWQRGSDQLPTVKTTISLNACCFHACIGEKYTPPQSGTTFELFAEECLHCPSMQFGADSPAKGIHLRDLENAWRTSARRFSGKLYGWRKKQKPRSFFSKMSGRGLDGLYQRSELRLKHWVTKSETDTWRHPMSGCPTKGADGSCLPTPCVKEGGYNQGGGAGRVGRKRYTLASMWRKGLIPTPTRRDERPGGYKADLKRNSPPLPALWKETTGTQLPPSFVEWIMGSPIGASALESWAIPSRGFSTGKRSKD